MSEKKSLEQLLKEKYERLGREKYPGPRKTKTPTAKSKSKSKGTKFSPQEESPDLKNKKRKPAKKK